MPKYSQSMKRTGKLLPVKSSRQPQTLRPLLGRLVSNNSKHGARARTHTHTPSNLSEMLPLPMEGWAAMINSVGEGQYKLCYMVIVDLFL